MMKMLMYCLTILVLAGSCKKNSNEPAIRYFLVGSIGPNQDWRDSAFVITADDPKTLSKIEAQLSLPVSQRNMVAGRVVRGSGGFNKNATHTFNWHYNKNSIYFPEVTAAIYDAAPYSGVELNLDWWIERLGGNYTPWGIVLKKEITP